MFTRPFSSSSRTPVPPPKTQPPVPPKTRRKPVNGLYYGPPAVPQKDYELEGDRPMSPPVPPKDRPRYFEQEGQYYELEGSMPAELEAALSRQIYEDCKNWAPTQHPTLRPHSMAAPAVHSGESHEESSLDKVNPFRNPKAPDSPSKYERAPRFIEGSLRDRASAVPPDEFIGSPAADRGSGNAEQDDISVDFQNRMQQASEQVTRRVSAQQSTSSSHSRNESLLSKLSKTASTIFHPWRASKEQPANQNVYVPPSKHGEKSGSVDLREQAAQRYAELKSTGQFSVSTASFRPDSGSRSPQRDSGVSVQDTHLPAPQDWRGKSLFTEESPRTRPSKSDLKEDATHKVSGDSHRVTKAIKKTKSSVNIVGRPLGAIRNKASMHEINKSSKLSKKISNLEAKLDTARRELYILNSGASPADEEPLKDLQPPLGLGLEHRNQGSESTPLAGNASESKRLPKLKASMTFRKRGHPDSTALPLEAIEARKSSKSTERDSPNLSTQRRARRDLSNPAPPPMRPTPLPRPQSSPVLPQIVVEAATPAQMHERTQGLDYTSPNATPNRMQRLPVPAAQMTGMRKRNRSYSKRIASIDGTLAAATAANSRPPSVVNNNVKADVRNCSYRKRSVSPLERKPTATETPKGRGSFEKGREHTPTVGDRISSLDAPELGGPTPLPKSHSQNQSVSRSSALQFPVVTTLGLSTAQVVDTPMQEAPDSRSPERGTTPSDERIIDSPPIVLRPGHGSVPPLPQKQALPQKQTQIGSFAQRQHLLQQQRRNQSVELPANEVCRPRSALGEVNVNHPAGIQAGGSVFDAPRQAAPTKFKSLSNMKAVVLPMPGGAENAREMMLEMLGEKDEQQRGQESGPLGARKEVKRRGGRRVPSVEEGYVFPEDVF